MFYDFHIFGYGTDLWIKADLCSNHGEWRYQNESNILNNVATLWNFGRYWRHKL